MRIEPKQVFRDATLTLLLAFTVPSLSAAQEPAENDWHIENATVTVVPDFEQVVDGRLIQRRPTRNRTLLELRGTLRVAGDGSFGPSSLADFGLLSGASDVPIAAELVAVGAATPKCYYLRRPIGAGNATKAGLSTGDEIAIVRDAGGTGPLSLRIRASALGLCMLFEAANMPAQPLHWSFAKRAIPLTLRALATPAAPTAPSDSAAPAPAVSPAPSFAMPTSWRQAIASPLLWAALALIAVSLVSAVAVQRMWQRSRTGKGSPSDVRSALSIPRVDSSHQPTTFANVEREAGPGQAQFNSAVAALKLGDWGPANTLFDEAMTTGLTPTFEAGAWSLRGEAMLNNDDLVGAATSFLRSLSCPGVTIEAALPAASQLAAIYRELGLRRDALKMDKLKASINPFVDDLGPQRMALIARLARELKHKKRARILARLLP